MALSKAATPVHGGFQVLRVGQGVGTRDGFDTAHASGHAAFGHDLEQADIAGALHVGAAAELLGRADAQDTHGLAVLLTEQHHGARLLCVVHVHHLGLGFGVGQHLGVHQLFHFADLLGGQRRVVRKVEAGAVSGDLRALLLHMVAQHFAQRLVHQVGGAVVAHGLGAQFGIHLGVELVAHFDGCLRPRGRGGRTHRPGSSAVSSTTKRLVALRRSPLSPHWPPDSA